MPRVKKESVGDPAEQPHKESSASKASYKPNDTDDKQPIRSFAPKTGFMTKVAFARQVKEILREKGLEDELEIGDQVMRELHYGAEQAADRYAMHIFGEAKCLAILAGRKTITEQDVKEARAMVDESYASRTVEAGAREEE